MAQQLPLPWRRYEQAREEEAGSFRLEVDMYDPIFSILRLSIDAAGLAAEWTAGVSRPACPVKIPSRSELFRAMHEVPPRVMSESLPAVVAVDPPAASQHLHGLPVSSSSPSLGTSAPMQRDHSAASYSSSTLSSIHSNSSRGPTALARRALSLDTNATGSDLAIGEFEGLPDCVIYEERTSVLGIDKIHQKIGLVIEVKRTDSHRAWGGNTAEIIDRSAQVLNYAWYMAATNDSYRSVVLYWTPNVSRFVILERKDKSGESWNSLRVHGVRKITHAGDPVEAQRVSDIVREIIQTVDSGEFAFYEALGVARAEEGKTLLSLQWD